jgi:hypothetical protein
MVDLVAEPSTLARRNNVPSVPVIPLSQHAIRSISAKAEFV